MHARGDVHEVRIGLHGDKEASSTIQLASAGRTSSKNSSKLDKLRMKMCTYADVLKSVVVLDSVDATVELWEWLGYKTPEEASLFEMFVLLRTAIKYYCVAQPIGTAESAAAASALLQYAKLAERYVTIGLHGSEKEEDKQLVHTYVTEMCSVSPMGLVSAAELNNGKISTPSAFGIISPADLVHADVKVFARANRANDEILNSSLYNKGKSRVDTWASVDIEEEVQVATRGRGRRARASQIVHYMAHIHRFLLVTGTAKATLSADKQPLPEPVLGMKFVFRLAICELWVTKEVYKEAGRDLVVADRQWSHPTFPNITLYPVDLSTFKCKYSTGTYDNKRYFFKPYNVSRRL